MPTMKTKARAKKTPAPRTRRRVQSSQPKKHMASASLSGKQAPKIQGTATLIDGEVLVSAVLAETVPVASFANVVIGPVGLQWKLGGLDISILADAEFGTIDEDGDSTFDYDSFTPEQKAVYDRLRGSLRATMKVIEHAVAEDRETVDRSVRMYEEREAALEAEEQEAKKRSSGRSSARKPKSSSRRRS